MKCYICIDGGTTNTRVCLVQNECVLDTIRIPLGARASIHGTGDLKNAIREAIMALLHRFSLSECDVTCILASGMITSEFGLCPLPHTLAPAGISELHATMHKAYLEEISQIPFVFIRGVKSEGEDALEADMMRGEETELYGLTDAIRPDCLYVLPGSHAKHIRTDSLGRISHFSTMLTGEMIAALAGGTILGDAVDLSIGELDTDALLEGYLCSTKKGINAALFKVRVMKVRFGWNAIATYSFFLGALLAPEIQAILDADVHRVVIGGKAQIKRATALILQSQSDKEIDVIEDASVDVSSALGAVRIFEFQSNR